VAACASGPRPAADDSNASGAATKRHPASAHRPSASNCTVVPGQASASSAADSASARRGQSGHKERHIDQTACATIATVTIFRPWTTESSTRLPSPAHASPCANSTSSMADGSVKPSQAANAPAHPARPSPSAKPTWLLAGPGRNWHNATSSA
jgi:hypothetical protein